VGWRIGTREGTGWNRVGRREGAREGTGRHRVGRRVGARWSIGWDCCRCCPGGRACSRAGTCVRRNRIGRRACSRRGIGRYSISWRIGVRGGIRRDSVRRSISSCGSPGRDGSCRRTG
jgi:hypothetical protein